MEHEQDDALPLLDHMIAGSFAGIAEHAIIFPVDTIKTHVQAASVEEIAANGTLGTARAIVRMHGGAQLFRGLSALLPAIAPAHAAMFASYEQVLVAGGAKEPGASAERVAVTGAVAGAVGTRPWEDAQMVRASGAFAQTLQDG